MTLVMRKSRAVEIHRPEALWGRETGANPGVESDIGTPETTLSKRQRKVPHEEKTKEDPTLLSTPGQESEIQA